MVASRMRPHYSCHGNYDHQGIRYDESAGDGAGPEYKHDHHVLWQVVDGPKEWIATKISFDLRQEGDWTIVLFKHQGWKEPVEFMHHCSTKWGKITRGLRPVARIASSSGTVPNKLVS
jgi:hypothetical protein